MEGHGYMDVNEGTQEGSMTDYSPRCMPSRDMCNMSRRSRWTLLLLCLLLKLHALIINLSSASRDILVTMG